MAVHVPDDYALELPRPREIGLRDHENSRARLSMRPAGTSTFWRAQRVLDVLRRKAVRTELVAVEPDAHGIATLAEHPDVGHPGQRLEARLDEPA